MEFFSIFLVLHRQGPQAGRLGAGRKLGSVRIAKVTAMNFPWESGPGAGPHPLCPSPLTSAVSIYRTKLWEYNPGV